MRRLLLLAGALAALAACGGDDRPAPPADGPTAGEPPSQDPLPSGGRLSPPVNVVGEPAAPPDCTVTIAEEPPDVAAASERSLSAVWEYAAPDGFVLGFHGLQDAEGDLYWLEWSERGEGAFLASATRDGAVRWRVAAPRPDGVLPRLVTRGRLVVTGGDAAGLGSDHPDRIDALDAATGAHVWTVDVAAEAAWLVPSDRGPARAGVRVDQPAVLDGILTVPVSAVDAPGNVWPGLLRVDAATGEVLELRAIATDLTIWIPGEPVVGAGTAFALVRPTHLSAAFLGFGPDGAARVAAPLPFDDGLWAEAATDRLVFASGHPNASGTPGAPFVQWSGHDATPRGRLAGLDRLLATGFGQVLAGDGTLLVVGRGRLAAVDLDRCALAWTRTLAHVPPPDRSTRPWLNQTDAIRTAGGGVLLSHQLVLGDGTSEGSDPREAWVVELDGGGREVLRGRLPDGASYEGGSALHRGRWFVATGAPGAPVARRLRAFDLAGQQPATTGWVTRHGSLTRERRAE
jgi:hypothetical protein